MMSYAVTQARRTGESLLASDIWLPIATECHLPFMSAAPIDMTWGMFEPLVDALPTHRGKPSGVSRWSKKFHADKA